MYTTTDLTLAPPVPEKMKLWMGFTIIIAKKYQESDTMPEKGAFGIHEHCEGAVVITPVRKEVVRMRISQPDTIELRETRIYCRECGDGKTFNGFPATVHGLQNRFAQPPPRKDLPLEQDHSNG